MYQGNIDILVSIGREIGLFSTYYEDQGNRCPTLLMCLNVPGADDVFEETHAGAYHLFGGGSDTQNAFYVSDSHSLKLMCA